MKEIKNVMKISANTKYDLQNEMTKTFNTMNNLQNAMSNFKM